MDKTTKIKDLEKKIIKEKQINRILSSEIAELKAINVDLRDSKQNILNAYQSYFPLIDRFKKSLCFKVMRKIKHIFRRKHERV